MGTFVTLSGEKQESFLNIEPIDLTYTGLKKDCLQGEVAVITGSASNVGLGYARAIAWAGGKVVVADLNETAGAEAERVINLESGPDSAIFVKTNVTLQEDIDNLAEKAFAKFGKVDMLLNNAMNMRLNGPILSSPVSDLEQSFAISGKGVMMAIKAFVPAMVERGHGVVTYSATQFHYMPPMVGGSMYTAGKASATSLIMSLANEVKGKGVHVFCLTPAGIGRPDFSKFPPLKPGEKRPMMGMPGFDGMIPPEVGGAGMVYSLLHAEQLHGSGILINDALLAMNFPYPHPEKVIKMKGRRLTDMELTMTFCYMGKGFDE